MDGKHLRLATMAVGLGMLSALATADEHPASTRIDQWIRPSGCAVRGGLIRLERAREAGADGIVAIEAETADELALKDRAVAVGFDAEASNGAYLHYVMHAGYAFAVAAPGAYRTWYRVYFPFKAHWNHTETLDGQSQVVEDNPNTIEGGEWLWLKGPLYELEAGEHRFSLDFHGGARLDKIVFASDPAFTPEGLGPACRFADAAAEGSIETPGIVLDNLIRWDRLSWESNVAGDAPRIDYSRDLGKTWLPLPSDGSLKDVAVVEEGYNGLKFRLALSATVERPLPAIQNVVLHFIGPPPLALENDKLRFEFSSTGQLIAMHNRQTGSMTSAEKMNSTLLSVTCMGPRGLADYAPARVVKQRVEGAELIQDYLLADGAIEARVRVTLDGETSRWRIALTNRSETPIVHVVFPILEGVRIPGDPAASYMFVSKFNGNLFRNPPVQKELFNALQAFGGLSLAMDWISWWNDREGIYFASHDPTLRTTGLFLDRFDDSSLKMRTQKFTHIEPGAAWESCEMVLALHAGDWHWGADRFREWTDRDMPHVKHAAGLPRWIREEFDGWQTPTALGFETLGFSSAMVRMFERFRRETGLTTAMVNRQSFDCNYAWCGMFPEANPTWGGAEEFRQGNEMIRERGGHTAFYINWNSVANVKSPRMGGQATNQVPPGVPIPTYDWFKRNAIVGPGGVPNSHIDEDAVYAQALMCSAATEFQEFRTFWVKRYVEDYLADGVYWDEMNAIFGSCYSRSHGHDDFGQSTLGSLKNLKEHADTAWRTNPDYFAAGESVTKYPLGQYVVHIADGNFASYELMRYTFPGAVLVGGSWPWLRDDPKKAREWENYCFLTGVRFMNPLFDDYSRRTLDLRRAVKQLLYPAVFRDTVGVTVRPPEGYRPDGETVSGAVGFDFGPGSRAGGHLLSPGRTGIFARRFTLAREGTRCELITALNTPLLPGGTILVAGDFLDTVNAAWRFAFDGTLTRIECRTTPEGYELDLPVFEQSVLALVERCEPLVYVEAPDYLVAGESTEATVRVLNLGPSPIRGEVSLAGEAGLSGTRASFEAASGAMATNVLTLTSAADMKPDRAHFDGIATVEGASARRLNWLYVGPPIRPAIDEDAAGLGLIVTLENQSGTAVGGRCHVEGTEHLSAPQTDFPFEIGPRQDLQVRMPLGYVGDMQAPELVTVWLEYGGVKRKLVRQVQPMVTNGRFEIDLAGDRSPDYWMGRRATDSEHVGYSQWRLDGEEKHEGRYSLRLEPNINVFGLNRRLWPGKTYRLTAALKREHPDGVVGVGYGEGFLTLPGTDAGTWRVLEATFTKAPGDTVVNSVLLLSNKSQGRTWFDAITIEEVAP